MLRRLHSWYLTMFTPDNILTVIKKDIIDICIARIRQA